MKTIIALASMAFLSTAAFAAHNDCYPVTGNWQNAATKSCPSGRVDGKAEGFPQGEHDTCEYTK